MSKEGLERIRELGEFLSGLWPNDLMYIYIEPKVQGQKSETLIQYAGFYVRHASEGKYSMELTMSPLFKHYGPITEQRGEYTFKFTENDGTDDRIAGFGKLEEIIKADYSG